MRSPFSSPMNLNRENNEGGSESETEPLANNVEFLSTIPPNWEAAEKHGIASIVYDPDKIKFTEVERC